MCLHEAYFAALQRKNKKMCFVQQDIEDSQRTALFWNSFRELETQVLHAPDFAMKSITLGLMKRRDLQRGIICNDSDLNQITTNIAMRMFTFADLKLEFEMNARPFWRQWDRFEYLVSKAPKGVEYLDAALTILHTYGEEGIHRVSELQNLFKLDPNKFSQDLLQLMCTTTIAKDMEEEELLHRRQKVETTLSEFQRYFLQDRVFKMYGHFSDSSNLIPTVHIKVY